MEKTYQPKDIETRLYENWESQGYFRPSGHGTPYSIMIPPPNVTGSLHMGHGFQDTIMDVLIRYHRMSGCNTLWQPGTDHAGIATQMVVERQLLEKGVTRQELGRDAFIDKIWDWKEESGGTITRQLRRLGASPDWSRERFTMDAGLSNAVQEVFVKLYNEGLIYRGQRLVNWDPKLHTAISDLEVVSEEEDGHMWHFKYPMADGSGAVVVATTRPETMLGDTCVAVNPSDERYSDIVGKHLQLPLCDRTIPIVTDDYVDAEFGTGCVKITPAHDFNDYEVGKRHNMPLINILTADANINDNAPEKYRGLSREEARKQVVQDLDELGLLVKVEPHKLKVPRGDRSGVVIEPWLTDQWYVDAKTMAKPAIEAVENGDINFVPKQWENTYFAWMRDIQDWCISRQLWWGHRIPAWYDDQGKVYVGNSEAEVRTQNNLDDSINLRQDNDVLDTWFSSALWTFSTLGWPEETEELKTFHPTSVLVTGFDIIFFWVARMIMMTLHFKKEVPFKTVYVHGLVRDGDGQKMSKSKGNVLDPIDLIDGIDLETLVEKRTGSLMQPQMRAKVEKKTRKEFPDGIGAFGTDALRFTYLSLASTGRDIKFDMGRIEGYRNFCNKIWNASRYVLMNTEEHDCGQDNGSDYELTVADKWITSRLQHTEAQVAEAISTYRFDLASQAIYEFVWNEYCDWYLELSKPVLWDENISPAIKKGTRRTLIRVLEASLRMAHPFMPFITEELWSKVKTLAGQEGETIMTAPYPVADSSLIDTSVEDNIEWVKSFIEGVRTIRGEMNIAPGKPLTVMLRNASEDDEEKAQLNATFLKQLAKLDSISILGSAEKAPMSATALVNAMEILVPMAGLIDKEAEVARLSKEIGKLEKETKRLSGKLSNDGFVAKAPEAVITKEREKLAAAELAMTKLIEQRAEIESL